jgi:AraC-like DNA-binding protein
MLLHHVLCRDFLLFHKKVTKKANPTPSGENKTERAGDKKPVGKLKAANPNLFSPSGPEGLSRKKFEQYFFKHKVYLDPTLTITGLAEQLATNRTYLSSFINKEYGMNFSRYVNSIRLKELDRLMSLPANEGVSIRKLAEKAGFGTYGGYLKARKIVLGKEENE